MKILISGYNTTKEMIESIMASGNDIQVICEDNVIKAADMACAELFECRPLPKVHDPERR